MRPDLIRQIASKELTLFFASSIGYLFLGAFLLVSLFLFFWIETFFARNVADVRPLFEWLPVLLIFLTAALTMRMWSEERRAGTLEFVATLPVSTWEFVVGKFLACWALLGIALALTLPLPVTVAIVADLEPNHFHLMIKQVVSFVFVLVIHYSSSMMMMRRKRKKK